MKYNVKGTNSEKHGKKAFVGMLFVLTALALMSISLLPPAFNECKSGDLSPSCTCPSNASDIGKRNIIFVDVTDPLPQGKKEDLDRLVAEVALREIGLFEWLRNGKRAERTSIFLLSDKRPSAMEPVASFCTLPPGVSWLFSEFSEEQEKKLKNAGRENLGRAIQSIIDQKGVTASHIVEGLAVATSNSSSWTPGGKLILVSDLFENSSSCGFFERETIPRFSSIGNECKTYVNILGSNLISRNDQDKTIAAICQLHTKTPKEGLVGFWKELFQSQLNYDVLMSCDPAQILQRFGARG
jgi:hypothetical protein